MQIPAGLLESPCHITPLCVSVDGMPGSEVEFFVKKLGDFLAEKWERPYGMVTGLASHL